MTNIRHIWSRMFFVALILILSAALPLRAQELRWAIASDPRSFDPALVDDDTAETLRYLTGGVLVRINRSTQAAEPGLAEHWKVSTDGRTLLFSLRRNLHFSDGSALSARDVAWTLRHLLDPKTVSPVAEEFIQPAKVMVETPDASTVRILLPVRLVMFESLFDEIAIQPEGKPFDSRTTAGYYVVDSYRRGQFIALRRNPFYWRRDKAGAVLPSIASIRLEIMPSREEEVTRFRRGQLSLIDGLPPEDFALLHQRLSGSAQDAGPSLDTEQMWFNQTATAPLPAYERAWFQSRDFRVAIAESIDREDLVRAAFEGHATPADGFISPANARWRNTALHVPRFDRPAAAARLQRAGFSIRAGLLYDASGHQVTFSLLTNAGNTSRERMAALIQQDLARLGMRINVVTLDFPALVERLMHTQSYEACLLGVVNVQPDPATGANVWLSSSENHQWNPSQLNPATPWEAEIDHLVAQQAASSDPVRRKQSWDRIQQIVADEQPFVFLVHRNILFATSPDLDGVQPTALRPQILWNVEWLKIKDKKR